MSNKRPPLYMTARRVTVEFQPPNAERLDRELTRRRETDPTASVSQILRDLVRKHLPSKRK